MNISSINQYNNTNFKNYYTNYSQRNTAQRLGIGASSVLLPGLGQLINGEYAKGTAFFLATLLNYVCFKKNTNRTIGTAINLGLRAITAYDAYKHS